MLYLVWALLNIGLFIFFIVICFNATKLIKEKFGVLTSIVFVLGLLLFIEQSNVDKDNKEPNSNQIKTWKFNSSDSLDKGSIVFRDFDLEKTLISKYSLGIGYGKDKQLQNNIPVSANTWTTGFESGTSWEPISIIINRTDDNLKFEYDVNGTIKWNLLGMTMYSQPKHWKGIAVLK
jgi:energy-coupling factor transporter transmembrane protein EcfT